MEMLHFEVYSWVSRLLVKASEGSLTEEEERRLSAWRESDASHEALYGRVMSSGFRGEKLSEWRMADSVGAYLRVWTRCMARRRLRLWGRLSVAAAVLLVLGWGVYGLQGGVAPVSDSGPVLASAGILPGSARAELILSGGERVLLGDEPADSVWVGEGLEVRTTGDAVRYAGAGGGGDVLYHTLRIPRGGEFTVELSDGTRVRLNSDSELRYPVRFGGGERRVYLSGEGYFEVVRDGGHPFVVEACGREVEVLGTTFNVCAYAEDSAVAATLVEGSVRFSAGDGSVDLLPGEQGVSDVVGHVEKREVDVYAYVAWQKGQFVFRHRTLEDVMRVVSRWYNVDAVFEDEGVKGVYLTGNMRRYGDFSQVVGLLELTGGLAFRIEGRTIYISEKKNGR